jgi:radical SAM superfamily enzyme YgiQ (UPF0313 family)
MQILAVSPPEFEKNLLPTWERMSSVNSDTPYAIMATLVPTFEKVRRGILDVHNWWTKEGISESVFLMHHWNEERDVLKEKIQRLKPDIVLIGTFAMNFPWAIEVATMVRQLCPDTLIVLWWRHIGETFWSEMNWDTFGDINEHVEANPLRLMEQGKIPPCFNLVVSGDWQGLIPAIIKIVEDVKKSKHWTPHDSINNLSSLKDTPGYWTLWKLEWSEIVFQQPDSYKPWTVDHASPYIYSGIVKEEPFAVFSDTDWTAHVHSDSQWVSWNTCTQNCDFCSEASGKVQLKQPHEIEAGERLFKRFNDIIEVSAGENKIPSIFVEDSILCGGHFWGMERFAECLEEGQKSWMNIPEWWCQFTVPVILSNRWNNVIQRLKKCGLKYIYFGLESAKPGIAQTIAKTGLKNNSEKQWSAMAETAIANLTKMGLKVGTSNIFCMGESHEERMSQLHLIKSWQAKYQWNPCVYSLNLQTVHPGEWGKKYTGQKYDYTQWWLDPADPRSPILQELFGEASMRYLRYPDQLPNLHELVEIKEFLTTMENAI